MHLCACFTVGWGGGSGVRGLRRGINRQLCLAGKYGGNMHPNELANCESAEGVGWGAES